MSLSVCLQVCMCIVCVPVALGTQKEVPDSLELELQEVVSYHMHASNWT